MRCAPRASNGPNHLGPCALQGCAFAACAEVRPRPRVPRLPLRPFPIASMLTQQGGLRSTAWPSSCQTPARGATPSRTSTATAGTQHQRTTTLAAVRSSAAVPPPPPPPGNCVDARAGCCRIRPTHLGASPQALGSTSTQPKPLSMQTSTCTTTSPRSCRRCGHRLPLPGHRLSHAACRAVLRCRQTPRAHSSA